MHVFGLPLPPPDGFREVQGVMAMIQWWWLIPTAVVFFFGGTGWGLLAGLDSPVRDGRGELDLTPRPPRGAETLRRIK